LGAAITDASVGTLAGMTRLRELILYRSRVTNAGLARLGALKDLASLDLRYSRVTGTGIEAFRAAVPNCKVNFVNARIEKTARSRNTTVNRPAGAGAEAIAAWVRSLGGQAEFAGDRLRAISLASTGIGDARLAHLASLSSLESLDLEAAEIGDLGLESLKGLVALKVLNLSHTTVSDAGLTHLAGLRELRELRVGGTLVRGPGLANLKSLIKLDLTGAPIIDEGLRQIAEIAGL
jgi:hypothetical protein